MGPIPPAPRGQLEAAAGALTAALLLAAASALRASEAIVAKPATRGVTECVTGRREWELFDAVRALPTVVNVDDGLWPCSPFLAAAITTFAAAVEPCAGALADLSGRLRGLRRADDTLAEPAAIALRAAMGSVCVGLTNAPPSTPNSALAFVRDKTPTPAARGGAETAAPRRAVDVCIAGGGWATVAL